MKTGWEIKPLGEVCEKTNNIKWNIGFSYEYIDLSSVSRETFSITETTTVNSENAPSRAKKIILKDDVIFATTRPTLNRATIIPQKYDGHICSTGFSVIRPKKVLMSKYVFYFIQGNVFISRMKALQRGASYPAVTDKDVKQTEIPIPPLAEQQQIVAILDKAFAAIDQAKANIEQNIANAEELFQSKLNAIFSQKGEDWEEKKLIEISKFIDYRGKTPQKTDSGIKLITAKNVRMGYMRNEPQEFIAEADYNNWMTRGIPQKGDVLFTTEAPLANVALLNTDEKIALAQRIITLCPERELLSGEYLAFCLQSKVIQDKILEKGTGATVTGIKSKLLKEIVILVPPLSSQDKIVGMLEQLRKYYEMLINNQQKKYNLLEELKKSLLQKAFAGELTGEIQ